MYLLVHPNGGKYWQMSYRFLGKQKTLALGVYPTITLADARSHREDARRMLANGVDPGAAKQTQKKQAKIAAANSFDLIARELHNLKAPQWSISHAADWIKTLEKEIFPRFGDMPISEISNTCVLRQNSLV
jgi:hypothetical protein